MARSLTLITGAPGWLGSRLVEVMVNGLPEVPFLAAPDPGRRIRCLVLRGVDARALRDVSTKIELVEGDICDPSSLKEFFKSAKEATLFHMAGIVHPARGIRQLFQVHVTGTQNLLAASQAAGVKRFIAVSSNSPIGCNPHRDHVFDEAAPYRPYMAYGQSKKIMEDLINETFVSRKIETVVIRPCWFYGPGQPPRQTLFFKMIKNGKAVIVGDGESRRSMSYLDNVCQGLLLAEHSEAAKGQTYWIADRRPYSMNEIVNTIARLLEQEFGMQVTYKQLHLPDAVSQVAWLCDWVVQKLGMYQQKVHVLSEMNKTIACSIAKAEKELGYDPKIALEEGMRRSIGWCLDKGIMI